MNLLMKYSEAFIYISPYSSPPPCCYSILLLLISFLQSPSSVHVFNNLRVFCIKMECTEQVVIADFYCAGTRLESQPYYRVFAGHSTQLSLFFLFLLYPCLP